MPRLLRLAKCQGYASFASGCGGILCPILQRSPLGDSTLMTSAPKSDKITAALGPAMKLAKSTTFNPEKILSFAIEILPTPCVTQSSLPAVESGHSLLKEGSRAFILIFSRGAEAEVRSLQQQAFALAPLDTLVCRFKCELDGDGGVGGDPP